jgi:polyisoprenyl-phosphate glycosyltransferase
MTKQLISIISPVHNEEENILEFVSRVSAALSQENWELILIDDGSTDSSYDLISEISKNNARIKPIKLSRNFGHQPAISCGIDLAEGDAVVILDSDLQDPPEVIPQFLEMWREGYDVVYGKRHSRKGESFFKKISAKFFYRFLNSLSDTKLPVDAGDFRLLDKRVVSAINSMHEKNRYLRGMIAWVGFNQIGIPYEREPRTRGKTKFNLVKMLSFASDGIVSFSTKPLKITNWISFVFALCAVSFGVNLIYQKIFFPERALPGFISTILIISIIASIQFFVIGIIGAYIGRIFKEVKNRPLYFIDE